MDKQASTHTQQDSAHTKQTAQSAVQDESLPEAGVIASESVITRLQRTIGNKQVQRLLHIQHRSPAALISRHPDDVHVAAAREEAKKFDAIRAVADNPQATLEALTNANKALDAVMTAIKASLAAAKDVNWKKPISTIIVTGDALGLRITTAVKARADDAKYLDAVLKKQAAISNKYKNVLNGAGNSFNSFVKTSRDALGEIASAGTAEAINLAWDKSKDALTKSTAGLAKMPIIIAETQAQYDLAHDDWRKITNLTTASTSAGSAIATMSKLLTDEREAQALATLLDGFVGRAAGHAASLAQARLNAIAKTKEAQDARAQATELQQKLDDAKKADEDFQAALEKVKQDNANLQAIQSQAEKLVATATENVAELRKNMQKLATDMTAGDAEPYMVEGYMNAAQAAVDAAVAALADAKLALQDADENLRQGMLKQATAQSDADAASAKATDPATLKGVADAALGATQAEANAILAGEQAMDKANTTHAATVQDTQEQAAVRALRDVVGTQVALDELLTFIPDKNEAKTLLDDLGYPFLLACLKDPLIRIDKLRPFHAAYKATYLTDCNKEHLKSILRTFTVPEFQTLHSKVNYDKLKAWIASAERDNLKSYVDDFTMPHFEVWQAQFTVPQMIEVIQKFTMPKLKTVAANFTALEFKPYMDDFTTDQLAELLTGFTAAELKAYVVTLTYAKLKEMMNVRGLASNALIKYEAAWLKTFVGVGANTMNHLTNIGINVVSAQISGGHDQAAFTNYINANYGGTAQPRGAITKNDGGNPIARVYYTLYFQNGTIMTTTGYKSLIVGLAGNVAHWQGIMNTALWGTLKSLKFDKAGGVRIEGGGYGFYYNGGTEVDTAFPL